ncbi:MAG TPA: hypothetical protein VFS32_14555 [Candidatus Limnocylindrales bacterium]|nr:hypothetical protein [Candidatus Limnocylindrales bacterium]
MRTLLRLFGFAWVVAFVGGLVGAVLARQRVVVEDDPEASEISLLATFGPLEFVSTASTFRGGTVECWYGGGTIDLRSATLDPAGATLRVTAVFGGAQVIVPSSWPVRTSSAGLGGINDARQQAFVDESAPALTIEGVCVLGGFGVMSERPDRPFEPAMPA